MKKIIISLFILFAGINLFAQNVVINDANPHAPLHVQGDLRFHRPYSWLVFHKPFATTRFCNLQIMNFIQGGIIKQKFSATRTEAGSLIN